MTAERCSQGLGRRVDGPQATKVHDDALAKVNAAYNKLLDEAEKLPTPRKNDLSFEKPRYMADDAKPTPM